MTAESLAQAFHEAYERLAPEYGYSTRQASRKPWSEVPEPNKALMIAVCREVMLPLLGVAPPHVHPFEDHGTIHTTGVNEVER